MEGTMPQSEYLFSSKRLGFRLIEDTDFDALKDLDMDPEVRTHFPEGILTPEQIKERISKNKVSHQENGFGDFAVLDLKTRQFVGRAGFALTQGGDIEVGYVFLKHSRICLFETFLGFRAGAGELASIAGLGKRQPRCTANRGICSKTTRSFIQCYEKGRNAVLQD
jgi:hypothetical protein